MTDQLSILINAPVEKIFQYITRHEVRKYWQPDLLSTLQEQYEKFKTTSSINTYIDIVKSDGNIKALEARVLQSLNNHIYSYLLTKTKYTLYITFTLKQEDETSKSLVLLNIRVRPKRVFRLFTIYYLRKEYRSWQFSLSLLKNLLES